MGRQTAGNGAQKKGYPGTRTGARTLWGICSTQQAAQHLKKGNFRVCLDSTAHALSVRGHVRVQQSVHCQSKAGGEEERRYLWVSDNKQAVIRCSPRQAHQQLECFQRLIYTAVIREVNEQMIQAALTQSGTVNCGITLKVQAADIYVF